MENFKFRLKELISNCGKQQTVICKELNIPKQKMTNWKSGYTEPNLSDIVMLAKYFNVSTGYLLGIEDDFGISAAATDSLAANEQELLSCFRQLSPYLQGVALNAVRGWAGMSPKEERKQNKS